jgi:hypothetical protein
LIRVEKEFSGGREAKGVLICPGNRSKKASVWDKVSRVMEK